MEPFVFAVTTAAIVGCGLIAGTFFVFSVAVMTALGRLSPADGMRAMQSINRVILNPIFLGVFLGTGVLSLVIIVINLLHPSYPGWGYSLLGATFYLIGSVFVTIVFNVPLNNALAAVEPGAPEGDAVWQNYLRNWTYWNHVRTLASLISTTLFIIGFASHRS